MPNILKPQSFSFSAKSTLTLIILALFLLGILFALIIPKMQKEQENYAKEQIEKIILTTKEQIDVAGKAISIQSKLERSETKYKIQTAIYQIKEQSRNFAEAKKLLQQKDVIQQCSFILSTKKKKFEKINTPQLFDTLKNLPKNTWTSHEFQLNYKTLDRKSKYFSYTSDLNFSQGNISVLCSNSELNKHHRSFEEGIKKNVQKTFALTQKFHKGKSYLIWINPKYINNNSRPLYETNPKLKRKMYSISNMSNVSNIHTGDLTAKQIFDNKDKAAIEHKLNGKSALTWVSDLSDKGDTYIFLLITTIYLDDLHHHLDSAFWKILPAALTALILAIIAGFFMFKQQFSAINILSKTAKEINSGNKNIRSHITGNDDIGSLGIAFDSMLDSLQHNIQTLDSKVEEKTLKLQASLEEKETLLKEIHHRVKNNLALTISLIRLQQSKIQDQATQRILTDIQERIYTMELLHRKLYESSNLNQIAFDEYIHNLSKDIAKTYKQHKHTHIDLNMEAFYFNIETTMSLGIIVNEILTNAFKYAFVEQDNPQLCIYMEKINDTHFALVIKDNGPGIPEHINIHTTSSLGLKLIDSIGTLQLHGEVKYSYDNGAVFTLFFQQINPQS